MKEWICEEVPALTMDGKVISTMLHHEQELVRCKDCVNKGTSRCPCYYSGDPYIDWEPNDDWYCADGEKEAK